MAGVRLVLDTQVWLDWLVFDDRSVATLRDAHAAQRVDIVIDGACEAELVRVLAYDLGRFTLEPDAQTQCIARCRAIARRVSAIPTDALPRCRDADDQKFLELAAAAQARYLVSKDQALLELAPRVAQFRIVAPDELGEL